MSIDALKQIYLPSLHLPEVAINWITCVDADIGKTTLHLVKEKMCKLELATVSQRCDWVADQIADMNFIYCKPADKVHLFQFPFPGSLLFPDGKPLFQILSSIPLAQPTCELSSRTMGPIDSQPVQMAVCVVTVQLSDIDSVCQERKTVQSFVASPWADCMASYLLPIKTLHQHLSDTKADNIFADVSLTSNDSAEEPYIDSHPGVVAGTLVQSKLFHSLTACISEVGIITVAVQWTVHRRYGGTASLMMLDRTGWWTDGWSAVGKLDDAMNYSPAISILGVTWNRAVPVLLILLLCTMRCCLAATSSSHWKWRVAYIVPRSIRVTATSNPLTVAAKGLICLLRTLLAHKESKTGQHRQGSGSTIQHFASKYSANASSQSAPLLYIHGPASSSEGAERLAAVCPSIVHCSVDGTPIFHTIRKWDGTLRDPQPTDGTGQLYGDNPYSETGLWPLYDRGWFHTSSANWDKVPDQAGKDSGTSISFRMRMAPEHILGYAFPEKLNGQEAWTGCPGGFIRGEKGRWRCT
ncbi:hypothetical protein B0H14DRAFT_2642312 [Mycena olivaceomarginata]|nr:hypothetical protein B0H14DRAFT_2642312 [Mycena olivaceomarginata]